MFFDPRIGAAAIVVFSLVATDASAFRFGRNWQSDPVLLQQPGGSASEEPAIRDTLPLPSLDARFESAHFSGSGNCSQCHDDLRDAAGNDVSIVKAWSGSMMAHAMRDPVFQAKVASELKRHPALAEVINDKCLRCHAPMASIDAGFNGDSLTLLENRGVLHPDNPYHDQAMEGVSCTACHQIEDTDDLGEPSSFSGGFHIPTVAESSQRFTYGQFPSPFVGPMRRATGFEPKYSAHMDDSALCATCHELRTPIVATDGAVVTEQTGRMFPEQAVYSEWEQSEFADTGLNPKSCQDCHMPSADGVRMASRPRRLGRVDDFKRHGFGGANTVVLSMLDKHREDLGVSSGELEQAISASRQFLRTAAEIQVLTAQRIGQVLEIDVEVINNSGHKLPTGYPSRRVWIDLQVVDASGGEIFRSGAMNADGSIVGVDADHDAGLYEAHHEVITDSGQVQVYESVMSDTDGNVTHTLLSADGYLKDNRMLPRGFDKTVVDDDIAVFGRGELDNDFSGGGDVVGYRIPVSSQGPFVVRATLFYQPLSAAYLNDLFEDVDLPLVKRLAGYWRSAEVRAEILAAAERVID